MQTTATGRLKSVLQAAHDLNVSRASVYRLHASGVLPFVKIGGRTLVDVSDIEALIANAKQFAA